jgi:acetolactate decarboxylase
MRFHARLAFLVVGCLLASSAGAGESGRRDGDALFQVSTLSALSDGQYDGRLPFRDLESHGNFGLGTFDHLDGEMVAVDGKFFQVRPDGVPTRVQPNETTPFAAVTFFHPDLAFRVEGVTSCATLRDIVQSRLASKDTLYAVKVTGTFLSLRTRSVPRQEKPYVPLAEALEDQVVFDLYSVDATMAGFWLPAVLSEVNAAGFHFHALTRDETAGGHVLDCETLDVRVEIDRTDELQVEFGAPGRRLGPPPHAGD